MAVDMLNLAERKPTRHRPGRRRSKILVYSNDRIVYKIVQLVYEYGNNYNDDHELDFTLEYLPNDNYYDFITKACEVLDYVLAGATFAHYES